MVLQWISGVEGKDAKTWGGKRDDTHDGSSCIMIEFFAGKPVFNGIDEITQLDIIYKTMGTPTTETWPSITKLPWYDLVRPKEQYPNKFRELYEK